MKIESLLNFINQNMSKYSLDHGHLRGKESFEIGLAVFSNELIIHTGYRLESKLTLKNGICRESNQRQLNF